MIPVAYAPSSVVLDPSNNTLIVANDKGIGARLSYECDYDVCDYNTHQDNGTVSIVPVPLSGTLQGMTQEVVYNNHWDLTQNIASAGGGSPSTLPVPIPAKIGDLSLIKRMRAASTILLLMLAPRPGHRGAQRLCCAQVEAIQRRP
jgi:hypothetical protein